MFLPSIDDKKKLGLSESDLFINDGVVLMNLDGLKEIDYKIKFLDCISYYKGNPSLSEGVINKVCREK